MPLVTVNSRRLGLGGLVFGTSLIERSKDSVGVVEVVVHDVDKERCVHELRYEFLRR